MLRSIVVLFIGVVGGSAGVMLLTGSGDPLSRGQEPVASSSQSITSVDAAPTPAASAAVATGNAAERVAIYERAVQATDTIDIETMIDFAAARAGSFSRDLEVEVLLNRLAEIDPLRAVRFAQTSFLDARFVAQAFEALARSDTDLAIAELAGIASPKTKREVALALLSVTGFAESAIARVASGLPVTDRVIFRMDAVIARAVSDGPGAVQALLTLEPASLQSQALPRVAEILARSDPLAALAQAELIADERLSARFRNGVLVAWADADADAVFVWLESADGAGAEFVTSNIFQTLASTDPERVLALADQFPPALERDIKLAVLMSLGAKDPLAALARIDLLPPGESRESAIQSIAGLFGQNNPDAALAWVKSLSPPSDQVMSSVIQGIMRTDPVRAIDEMLTQAEASTSPVNPLNGLSFMMMLTMNFPAGTDFAPIANRLVASDASMSNMMFTRVMSRWTAQDPSAALNWAMANVDQLEPAAFSSLASTLAQDHPELAMQTMSRLASRQREGWMSGVAQGLARADLDRAIDFVQSQRGQPGYDDALANLVSAAAQSDPARAARLLAESSASPRVQSAATMVAMQWAQQDPAAAAAWVESLEDRQLQAGTTRMITAAWAQSDPNRARNWMLALPGGETRDSAVGAYMQTMARSGEFDASLLDSISTDSARQNAAQTAIVEIGRNDLTEARRLLDVYMTDPASREQTERMLDQSGGAGDGRLISTGGGTIFLR